MSEVRHATDPVSGQRVEIRNDLTKRLRGLYASGPTMPNGEPEFGWRQFGDGVPIQIEAATEIDRLRDALRDLADAADTVGVAHFDTDDMSPEVTAMQDATKAARTALAG